MARSKFQLRDRVTVPGFDGIQGVVVGRADFVKGESVCTIAWVSDGGELRAKSVPVSELAEAAKAGR